MKKGLYVVLIVSAIILMVAWVASDIFRRILEPAPPLSAIQSIKIDSPVPMPRQVDVNGIAWQVKQTRFADPALQGRTRCEQRIVELKADAARPREALLHELLHAQVCHYVDKDHDFEPDNMYYNSTSNDKHEGIYNIAAVVSGLLARNPDLARYMGEGEVSLGMVSIR